MANVVGSFAQGMQIGNGLIDIANRREDRERQREEYEHNKSRRSVLESRQDEQYQFGLEDRKESKARQKVIQGREDKRWEMGLSDREEKKAWDKKVKAQQETEWTRSNKEYDHQVKIRRRQEGYETIFLPALDKAIATGDYSLMESPEYIQYVKENPQFDVNNILGDAAGKSLTDATQLLRGASNGQVPDARDPKLIGAMEGLFPEITGSADLPTHYVNEKGESHLIKKRAIAAVHAMPNGMLTIEQAIELDNGETVVTPLTNNRSSDPNDTVMQIPLSALTERMKTLAESREHLKKTQLNNWRYLQTGRALGLDKDGNLSAKSTKGSTATDYTKQYLSEETKIRDDILSQIQDVRAMGLEPQEEQARIAEIERKGEARITEHRKQYQNFATVNDPDEPQQERLKAARNVVNSIVKQYADYNFPVETQQQIQNALLKEPNMELEELQGVIQDMIKNGAIKLKTVGVDDPDSLVEAMGGKGGEPQPGKAEELQGSGADEYLARSPKWMQSLAAGFERPEPKYEKTVEYASDSITRPF